MATTIPQWLERTLLAIGLLSSSVIAAWIVFAAPQFGEVFSAFGAEIPLVTRLVVRFYLVFLLLPLLVWAVWRYWPYPAFRSVAAAGWGVVSAIVVLALFTWVMYLPIFKLGVAP